MDAPFNKSPKAFPNVEPRDEANPPEHETLKHSVPPLRAAPSPFRGSQEGALRGSDRGGPDCHIANLFPKILLQSTENHYLCNLKKDWRLRKSQNIGNSTYLLQKTLARLPMQLRNIAAIMIMVMATALTCPLSAQSTLHTYAVSDAVIPNPDRGFYHPVSTIDASTVSSYRAQGTTLFLLEYVMSTYQSKNLTTSSAHYSNFKKALQNLAKFGAKCVVRFCYTDENESGSFDNQDASIDQIKQHIATLKPLFQDYAPVISAVQAGFIGTWGEWYYTRHTVEEKNQVIDALLDAVPASIPVLLRTPGYKRAYLSAKGISEDYLTAATAYDGSPCARLGYHDDAIVNGADDQGTFVATDDADFTARETQFVPFGGETDAKSQLGQDTAYVHNYAKRFHLSWLNNAYHQDLLNYWKQQGDFYNQLSRDMGYRLVLSSADFDETATANADFTATVAVKNLGFAAPYTARALQVWLVNQDKTDSIQGTLTGSTDSRKWWPGNDTYEFHATFTADQLKQLTPGGTYKLQVALRQTDVISYTTRSRVGGKWVTNTVTIDLGQNNAFSIQMSNVDTWDAESGRNTLGNVLIAVPPVPVTGNTYVRLKNKATGTYLTASAVAVSDLEAQRDEEQLITTGASISLSNDATASSIWLARQSAEGNPYQLLNYQSQLSLTQGTHQGSWDHSGSNVSFTPNPDGTYCISWTSDDATYYIKAQDATTVANGSQVAPIAADADYANYKWNVEYVTSLPVTLSPSDDGNYYASFYTPVALTQATGCEVYTATSAPAKETATSKVATITLNQLTGDIPAGTLCIVKGSSASASFPIVENESGKYTDGNTEITDGYCFHAVLGYKKFQATESGTSPVYSFGYGSSGDYKDKLAFYHMKAPMMVKGQRLFIPASVIDGGTASSVQALRLKFQGGTTGINTVTVPVSREDGQYIFDLSGRRVTRPAQGIYIKNGKKNIIR